MQEKLLLNFLKIKICGGDYFLKIGRMYSFTGVLELMIYFSIIFSNQTKVVNEITEILVEFFASCRFNT